MILIQSCNNPLGLRPLLVQLRLLESLVGLSFQFVCSWNLGDGGRRRMMISGLSSLASWNLGDGGRRMVSGFCFLVVCLWDFAQMRWGSWVVILCGGCRRRKMVLVSLAPLQLQRCLCCMC